jgi:hypothetical protein
MLLINDTDTVISGSTGDSTKYSAFEPWKHASGVARWVIDNVNFTAVVEGYHIRERTAAEIQALLNMDQAQHWRRGPIVGLLDPNYHQLFSEETVQ